MNRTIALLCVRAASLLMDAALRLTPSPARVLRDDMDDDMRRAMRDGELLSAALRGVVG